METKSVRIDEPFSNEKTAPARPIKVGMTTQEIMSLLSTGVAAYSTAPFITDDLTTDKDIDDSVDIARNGRLDQMDIQGLTGAVAAYVQADDANAAVSGSDDSPNGGNAQKSDDTTSNDGSASSD